MVNLHFDCNHFTILESKVNFAFEDGDFFGSKLFSTDRKIYQCYFYFTGEL